MRLMAFLADKMLLVIRLVIKKYFIIELTVAYVAHVGLFRNSKYDFLLNFLHFFFHLTNKNFEHDVKRVQELVEPWPDIKETSLYPYLDQ